jgi:thiol:disulfide interchange protein DsbD
MIKRFYTLFIIIGVALGAMAQMAEPVKFSVSEKINDKGQLEISFRGTIEEGWHVYGTNIPEGGPTATTITLEKQDGANAIDGIKTIGDVHRGMDPMFGVEVETIEKEVTFVQTYEVDKDGYNISGYLTYGACNDENCLPPTTVDFCFKSGNIVATEAAATDAEAVAETNNTTFGNELWAPVTGQLQSDDNVANQTDASLFWIFLMGMGGGLLALLTPCVWPIIPMTVSFFLKRSKDNRRKGIQDAITYGISIIVIYVGLGMLVTICFGASALNAMSTNAVFNILFFLLLVVFGLSFLGGFELTLPSSWSNAVDSKAEKTTGLLSIFLMAFTLSLVSFSCTGPIIGFLLVEVATSGSVLAPTMGMLGFAVALALPFTLFALFPTMLKSAPRSGNWMNSIKVMLGFLELAFSLKFLSVADLAYGWGILDREVFLCLWILLFAMMGLYMLNIIRLPHDEDEYDEEGNIVTRPRTGITRLLVGIFSLAFALYMIPGLWGAPCKAVSAFAPPMNTQDFNLHSQEVTPKFHDYDMAMAYAKEKNMPVMLDFTGYGCVNCRKMEAAVWTDPEVAEIINDKYVLVTLHVDDKTPLAEPITVMENGQERKLRTIGDRWSYLQRYKFGANAQPFYVLLNPEGKPLAPSYSFNEDVDAYIEWLNSGLK